VAAGLIADSLCNRFSKRGLGHRAWLINGLLWNGLFHLYTLYNLFTDLPFMLLIPFLAQRTQSTWTAVILHLGLQWLAFAILLPGVFGG
jgi:hypothetical protein